MAMTLKECRDLTRQLYLNESVAAQWPDELLTKAIALAGEEVYHSLSQAAPDRVTSFVYWPYLASRSSMYLNDSWLRCWAKAKQKILVTVYAVPGPPGVIILTDSETGVSYEYIPLLLDGLNETTAGLVAAINGAVNAPFIAIYTPGTAYFYLEAKNAGDPFAITDDSVFMGNPVEVFTQTVKVYPKPFNADCEFLNGSPGIAFHHVRGMWSVGDVTIPTQKNDIYAPNFAQLHLSETHKGGDWMDPLAGVWALFDDQPTTSQINYLSNQTSASVTYKWHIEQQNQLWIRPTPTSDLNLLIAYTPLYAIAVDDDDPVMAGLVFWPWSILAMAKGTEPQAYLGKLPVFLDLHGLVPLLAAINAKLMTNQDPGDLYALYTRRLKSAVDSLGAVMQTAQGRVPRASIAR